MGKKVLLIGAPGFISTHAVNEACKLGHTVAVVKRTETLDSDLSYPVQCFLGDRRDPNVLKKAKEAFAPQIVIDFACYEPQDAQAAVEVWRGEIEQYIFVSSVDAYGLPLSQLPYPEGEMSAIGHHTTDYAVQKQQCEIIFREAWSREGFPITIARPFYSIHKRALVNLFSGRDWNHEGGRTLVQRIRFGQPVISPGDGTTLFQAGCARNHGRMIAWLAGAEDTVGESYNCAHDSVITIDEYFGLIGKAVGRAPVIVHIPSDLLLSLDLPEVHDGYVPTMLQYNSYYSVEKFKARFPSFRWECSLEDALAEYLRWNTEQGLFLQQPQTYVEDRIIAAWEKARQAMQAELACEGQARGQA